MSHRELRSFTETMKVLGYPRLISLDNFRTPNFELVADCLHWLVQRFYPECDISPEISTEGERVQFLQGVAQVMLTKARLKLHIKKLYSADGAAVKELLKLASLLHKATQTAMQEDGASEEPADFGASLKGLDARALKVAAGEAVRAGAALHDALAAEPELRQARARALASHLDAEYVERCIAEAGRGVDDALKSVSTALAELGATETALEAKMEKRRAELERAEKRLGTLAAVRPAYMDEYEALQGTLQDLYGHYLERFRNLEFLEAQLDSYHREEARRAEQADKRLQKMQRRLAEEELRILRGEQEVDESKMAPLSDADDTDTDSQLSEDQGPVNPGARSGGGMGRPQGLRQQQQQQGLGSGRGAAGQAVGSMMNDDFGDEDDSINEDTATDGGEVSLAGSGDASDTGLEGSRQQNAGFDGGYNAGYGDGMDGGYADGLGGGDDDEDGMDDGGGESEDSGF